MLLLRRRMLPSESLIVEDSRNGLLAGNSAGVNVLVIPNEVTKHSDSELYGARVAGGGRFNRNNG
ncbi:Probable pseudouridine-5'-monophosphatase [Listeria monocytogenes N53-1]|nr:Probable pseudouridine-5'-monophosphatase [Listeria monocytogenes N53-1]